VLSLKHGVTVAAPDAHPARHGALLAGIAAAPPVSGLTATLLGRQLGAVLSALRLGAFHQPAFMVPFGGFETNRDQLNAQAALFAELDDALGTFYRAIGELGMSDRVTIYTDTEFNRTLVPNKSGGTEHAWGGHQLVVGLPTLGGRVYGRFPSLEVGGADDVAGNGTWAPYNQCPICSHLGVLVWRDRSGGGAGVRRISRSDGKPSELPAELGWFRLERGVPG